MNSRTQTTSFILVFLVIMQSFGIRAIPMQGSLFNLVIIFIVVLKNPIGRRSLYLQTLALVFGAALLLTFRSLNWGSLIPNTTMLVAVWFLLAYFSGKNDYLGFSILTLGRLLAVHAGTSSLLYLIVPFLFSPIMIGAMPYVTLGPFICALPTGGEFTARACGLLWEPGVLQYLLSVCFFLEWKGKKRRWHLALFFAVLLLTQSTTGMLNAIVILLYVGFSEFRPNRNSLLVLSLALLVGLAVYPLIQDNVQKKIFRTNTSTLVRVRDLLIGLELISRNPLVGIGAVDANRLKELQFVGDIENQVLGEGFVSSGGNMAGGFTNGLLGMFVSVGIPAGCLFLFGFARSQLVTSKKEKIMFLTLYLMTATSEPIFMTTFFFLLAIGGLCSRETSRLQRIEAR